MYSKKMKKAILKLKKSALGTSNTQIKKNAKKMSGKMTWPEREFKKLLEELCIDCEVQKILKNKIYDFYIPSKNLLVEVQGDYWHGSPKEYNPEDLNGVQKKNMRNDIYKKSLALTAGYFIEAVWESDLKNNYEMVKSRFKKILNNEN